ncbi:hypothetical protein BCV70DRAFT_204568 [Testicularia cyperi]|uniref:Uncharacterized protein n=1 Tax=Testicularia cyperi TaxID=1882483 RepID=A0A317XWS2_9BASI|nr:hypothetical protein BCV70DRAFT_204568 [Testicularia cyperi]
MHSFVPVLLKNKDAACSRLAMDRDLLPTSLATMAGSFVPRTLRGRVLLIALLSCASILLLSKSHHRDRLTAPAFFKSPSSFPKQFDERQDRCRQQWFMHEELCDEKPEQTPVDLVWLWSNESDPLRIRSLQLLPDSSSLPILQNSADLLAHSLRSAQQHLKYGFGTINLVTPDYAAPEGLLSGSLPGSRKQARALGLGSSSAKVPLSSSVVFSDPSGSVRLGQKPVWLTTSHPVYQPISVLHHWHLACARNSSSASKPDAEACRQRESPNFSGASISAMVANTPHLSNPKVVVSPEAIFDADVSASDFWNPLYGPTFRMDPAGVAGAPAPPPDGSKVPGQIRANHLIGQRFGFRDRSKLYELPNTVLSSTVEELHETWPDALAKVHASRVPSTDDIDIAYLQTHYIMERFREALLWSFFVARHDRDGDGNYSPAEAKALLQELGISPGFKGAKKVHHPRRADRSMGAINSRLIEAGQAPILARDRLLLSLDGSANYVPLPVEKDGPAAAAGGAGASSARKTATPIMCELAPACIQEFAANYDKSPSVNALFKRFTFQHWGCGDCLIHHLVGKSGEKGLSAFLPGASLMMPFVPSSRARMAAATEVLPMTATFEGVDFGIHAMAARTSHRRQTRISFASAILAKYQHSVAQVGDDGLVGRIFADAEDPVLTLVGFEKTDPPPTMFFLSDRSNTTAVRTRSAIRAWLETRFPNRMHFEAAL